MVLGPFFLAPQLTKWLTQTVDPTDFELEINMELTTSTLHRMLLAPLLWATMATGAAGQTVHQLDALLKAASEHVPTAAQKPLIEKANQLALAQLRANYLPQVNLNGQATWQSEVTGLPIQVPGVEIQELSKDQYRFTLDVLQPIWDGGQTDRQGDVQRANAAVETQRIAVEQYGVQEQVIQLYCAALLAERQARSVEAIRKETKSKRDRTDEQVRNGTAIPAHVFAFDARLLEMDQQREDARTRRLASIEGLALLTGVAIVETDSLAAQGTTSPTLSERPELTLFKLQQASAAAQEKVLSTRNMPRINAIATLGYGRPGLNVLSNEFAPYAILGANFKWNLSGFYNGVTDKEQQQLRILQDRIRHQSQQFSLMNQLKANQQQRDIERLEKALARDKDILTLREKVAATAAIQLENGTLTPSDYLTELTQVANARINTDLHAVQLLQAQLLKAWLRE
jgi:hypothetical protein